MNVSTILNDLLEAIVLQELAMANLIDAEGKLIQACSKYLPFQEYQIGLKMELDRNINTIFHSFSDHEKWNYKKLTLINELRQITKLSITEADVELNKEATTDNVITEDELNELEIENLLDDLDNEFELIDDEGDENDKPNE